MAAPVSASPCALFRVTLTEPFAPEVMVSVYSTAAGGVALPFALKVAFTSTFAFPTVKTPLFAKAAPFTVSVSSS